jgi:hypothetical protein
MDVEKAGTALANGDLEGFMALCDESERFTAGAGTLVIGRMGTMLVEYTDAAGSNLLQAHVHPSVGDAGACYAKAVRIAAEEAAKVNFLSQLMGSDERVSVSGNTPDYIPGDWTTV